MNGSYSVTFSSLAVDNAHLMKGKAENLLLSCLNLVGEDTHTLTIAFWEGQSNLGTCPAGVALLV